jgi:hypothetical protein
MSDRDLARIQGACERRHVHAISAHMRRRAREARWRPAHPARGAHPVAHTTSHQLRARSTRSASMHDLPARRTRAACGVCVREVWHARRARAWAHAGRAVNKGSARVRVQQTAETGRPAGSACASGGSARARRVCGRADHELRGTRAGTPGTRSLSCALAGKAPGSAANAAPKHPERHASDVTPHGGPTRRVLLPRSRCLAPACSVLPCVRCRVRGGQTA